MERMFHSKEFMREDRRIYLFKTLGENVKTWGRDATEKYVAGPVRRRSPYETAVGGVGIVASAITELPDHFYAGVVDQNITPPSGIAGRTRRDVGLLVKDVVTFHPLRAGGDAFRLVFNDLPMDGIDVIGGFHSSGGRGQRAQIMKETRANISSLAA